MKDKWPKGRGDREFFRDGGFLVPKGPEEATDGGLLLNSFRD